MFSSKKPSDTPASKPTRPQKTGLVAPSIVSSDVRLTGDLATPGEVQFDGTIEGDLRCGSLTVGEQAGVTGKIIADTIVIHGAVIGSVRARSVRLSNTAKVVGDIYHEDLVIDSGAYVEGRCVHVEDPLETDTKEADKSRAKSTKAKVAATEDAKPA
ncbi:MAG: polymer-forming cytoskeletal protein [Sphingomonadales bacterium]